MTTFTPNTIAALVIAASFSAGLNVYATVLTLGLMAHAGWVVLPGTLGILAEWWVIGVSGALFAVEFVADKIPGFDMVWNMMHTMIRIPIAALLAYSASSHLSPAMQLLATAAGASIALATHGWKTSVRAAVTPSPEPVSNVALSTTEDGVAIGLSWLVTQHPWTAASVAGLLTVAAILMTHYLVKTLRRWFRLLSQGSASPSN